MGTAHHKPPGAAAHNWLPLRQKAVVPRGSGFVQGFGCRPLERGRRAVGGRQVPKEGNRA